MSEVETNAAEAAKAAAAAAKAEAKAAKAKAAAEAKAAKDEAKAAAAKVKADAAAAKVAAKQAAEAAKAEAAAKKLAAKEAAKQPTQNGITRPRPGGKCAAAWDVFDAISAQKKSPCTIQEALDLSRTRGQNDGNVKTEYARWRKFHGVTGRIVAPKAEVAPAAQTA